MTKSIWLNWWNAIALLAMSLGALPAVAIRPNSVSQEVIHTSLIAVNRPVLKLGSQGTQVSELQAALKLLGYFAGNVDGFYGDSTVSAVAQFQQASGLNVDGIAGAATWERLFPSVLVDTPSTPRIANNRQITNSASGFPVPSSLQRTNVRDVNSGVNVGTTSEPVNRAQYRNPSITSTAANSQTVVVSLPILKSGMQGSAIAHLQERLRSLGFFSGSIDGVFGEATQAAVKAAQMQFKLEPDGIVGAATWSALLR